MPDFTMCKGFESVETGRAIRVCPMRAQCWRCTATPSEFRQSYFMGIPLAADLTCDQRIPHDGEERGA